MRVGDGAHRTHIVVRHTEERERDAAHERAVAVVALAIQTVVGVQGLVCGAPHTERCAVGRVFAVEQPIAVAFAQVVGIHHAVAVHQGIQCGQRH